MPALTDGCWLGFPVTGTNPLYLKEELSPHSAKFIAGFTEDSSKIRTRSGTSTNPSPRLDQSLFGSVEKE